MYSDLPKFANHIRKKELFFSEWMRMVHNAHNVFFPSNPVMKTSLLSSRSCGISLLKWMRRDLSFYHSDVNSYSAGMPSAARTILVFQHLGINTVVCVYQICMAKNLYVRIWEYTEPSKEKIHTSAHLDNLMHAQVFVYLWTRNSCWLLYVRFYLLCGPPVLLCEIRG